MLTQRVVQYNYTHCEQREWREIIVFNKLRSLSIKDVGQSMLD